MSYEERNYRLAVINLVSTIIITIIFSTLSYNIATASHQSSKNEALPLFTFEKLEFDGKEVFYAKNNKGIVSYVSFNRVHLITVYFDKISFTFQTSEMQNLNYVYSNLAEFDPHSLKQEWYFVSYCEDVNFQTLKDEILETVFIEDKSLANVYIESYYEISYYDYSGIRKTDYFLIGYKAGEGMYSYSYPTSTLYNGDNNYYQISGRLLLTLYSNNETIINFIENTIEEAYSSESYRWYLEKNN